MHLLTVVSLCILQIIVVKSDDIHLKYYNIISNVNNCSVASTIQNDLKARTTFTNNTVTIDLPFNAETDLLPDTTVTVSASFKNWTFNLEPNDLKFDPISITGNKKWELSLEKNGKEPFKSIVVESMNFTESGGNASVCFDVGVVYNNNKTTYNVSTVDLGCWLLDNSTQQFTYYASTNNLTIWAESLNQKVCSAAATLITAPFMIFIAFIINSIIKL